MNTPQEMTALRKNAIKGLYWMDFQRHKEGFLIGLPSIALVALGIGMVENAGGPMFLWMGLAMGVACGMGFGKGEWGTGVEEYSLALPPTRRDRYLVRFSLGIAFLLCMQFFGLAAGPLGWVRALGELLPVDLPAYRPDAPIWEGFNGPGFYVLSFGVTFAVFAEVYAVWMSAERDDTVLLVARSLPFVLGALLVLLADYHFMTGHVGYLTGVLGLSFAVPRTAFGVLAFERKDVVFESTGSECGTTSCKQSAVPALVVGLTILVVTAVWVYLRKS